MRYAAAQAGVSGRVPDLCDRWSYVHRIGTGRYGTAVVWFGRTDRACQIKAGALNLP